LRKEEVVGNTAKFMLVGILAMVIVIAVIWDRQSADLTKMASVSKRNGKSSNNLKPTLTDSGAQAEGTIKLVKTPEDIAAEELLQAMENLSCGGHVPAVPAEETDEPAAVEITNSPAQAQPAEIKGYIVQDGESFWTIARDQYGDANLWEQLWKANIDRCPRPESLRAGMTIKLPDLKGKRLPVASQPSPAGRTDANGKRYYTVKEGDCLGVISQKFYGTAKKWQMILDANNLDDERSLRAGMEIIIPPDK
jgi:nucleoid-associated protein YgaU